LRRLVAPVLMVSAAAAAMLVLGPAFGAGSASAEPPQSSASAAHSIHLKARASPLAGLNRTFLKLVPAARCDAGAKKARVAKRQRAVARRGAAKASPKVLNRKRKRMRRAIAVLRSAVKSCKVAAAPPAIAGTPPPAPPPAAQTITLHVASGIAFTEASATATSGRIRIELVNASSLQHRVGVRAPGQTPIDESAAVGMGGTAAIEVELPQGSYEILCRQNNHHLQGMIIPLTVNP
jgi:plastocyanin